MIPDSFCEIQPCQAQLALSLAISSWFGTLAFRSDIVLVDQRNRYYHMQTRSSCKKPCLTKKITTYCRKVGKLPLKIHAGLVWHIPKVADFQKSRAWYPRLLHGRLIL